MRKKYCVSPEGPLLDQKSSRAATGKIAGRNEIAKDGIAFAYAYATGGHLPLGIEDGEDAPPTERCILADLPDTLRRKLGASGAIDAYGAREEHA